MVDFTDKLRPAEPTGPDTLTNERAQSSLPVADLASHLLSTDNFLQRQDRILKELKKEKLLSKRTQLNLSRPDRYKLGLARAKLLRRMSEKLRWDSNDYKMSVRNLKFKSQADGTHTMDRAEYLVDDVSPYMLHLGMFATTIREQASDEQQAYWLPKIESFQIIGAYAQTEMGHGSNVKGIELEAKWDSESKEFTLHSPTLTSSKWWNGSLGCTANYAIVVAQLLLPREFSAASTNKEYVSHGPHPFIVQVRDLKTHKPLPGIAVGDIGPKYGYPAMDNAYMLFDNFRVPHSAFLCRYSKVDCDTGAYTKPKNPNVVYGSLTYVRANIVMHARLILARAVTVAVRYLAIRRQFRDRDGTGSGPEEAVLNYPTVQIRIFPLLATLFALHYTGQAMGELYMSTRKGIKSGDFSNLADLHSTSSGLKSMCTMLAADGIETCRRAMGGHGFGGGSGLIQLNNDYLSKPTVEGDNWMITQQTASHIIKKVEAAIRAPDSKSTDATDANLKNFLKARRYADKGNYYDILHNDKAIVDTFHFRAAHLSCKAYEDRIIKKKSWNSILIQLFKLSQAHSQAILVTNFYKALTSSDTTVPPTAQPILLDLFRLYALTTLDSHSREFLSCGCVSNAQLDALPDAIQSLMLKIRPHAVKLVDSWSIPDYLLDSALGRYDGRVYEDLFHRAHRENPLNKETFNPRYWEEEIVMGSGNGGQDFLAKL